MVRHAGASARSDLEAELATVVRSLTLDEFASQFHTMWYNDELPISTG